MELQPQATMDAAYASVYSALASGMDDYPKTLSMRGKEALRRIGEKMPRTLALVLADKTAHFEPFMRMIDKVGKLSPERTVVATDKEIDLWMDEQGYRSTPESMTYRICVHTLIQRVFCFSRTDLDDVSTDVYRAIMEFIVPIKRELIRKNNIRS